MPVKPAEPKRVLTIREHPARANRLAKRADIDAFIKFFDYSEITIRQVARQDKVIAGEILRDTINTGHEMFAQAIVRNFKWFEANPEKLNQRSWWVLFDGYCVAAELYYTHDKPPISDGVFDKIGRILYERYPEQLKIGFPEWKQYPQDAFTPANAHALHKNNLHLGVTKRIIDVLSTGPKLAPPTPRPPLKPGIKSRWS